MSSKSIQDSLLRHTNYLRSLNLQSPRIGNTFLEDQALIDYTNHIFGFRTNQKHQQFRKELIRLGDRFSGPYIEAARNAQQNQPRLEQFDTYGRRIDKLHLSEGWKKQAQYASKDGIVALAYQQDKYNLGQMQRLGQLIVLYMYQPSSGLYGCPLAMTDGAAYTIRGLLRQNNLNNENKQSLSKAYNHLTSRENMWTSGQWMTQKKGGSDVSNTQTIAVKHAGNKYKLYGYKWFTSATDSNMSLGLAKVLPENIEPTIDNIKKLKVSLFYIKMKNQQGQLNNMEIIRLKDKLGTKQLPTAQLLLKGTQAELISSEGQGVKTISKMLTITRIYNSATAVGLMRRGITLAKDYSARRTIGKIKLNELPLQKRVLSHLEVVHRGNLMLFIRLSQLFSKQQAKTINEHEANILRVMTPLMKLFTGKQVLLVLTQVLQSFGGMGYIQGSMLPALLRDAQVLSIWEGTTNVLCHDFVRALLKKENSIMPLDSLKNYFLRQFQIFRRTQLEEKHILNAFESLITAFNNLFTDITNALQTKFNNQHLAELRTYTFGLSHLFIGVQLLKHYLSSNNDSDFEIVKRWIERGLYKRQGYCRKKDGQLSRQNSQSKFYGLNKDSRGSIRSRL